MNGPRHPLPPLTDDAVSLTLAEGAALLRLPLPTLRRGVRAGYIPARRFGREYRLHRAALLDWLRAGDEPTRRTARR